MKKLSKPPKDDVLPEYDFAGKKGKRGKYFHAYQKGHVVRILQEDGTVELKYYSLEDGAVLLEPDVRAYFPDSESVNKALRSLIALIPKKVGQVSENKSKYGK